MTNKFKLIGLVLVAFAVVSFSQLYSVGRDHAYLFVLEDDRFRSKVLDNIRELNIEHTVKNGEDLYVNKDDSVEVRKIISELNNQLSNDEVSVSYTDERFSELLKDKLSSHNIDYEVRSNNDALIIVLKKNQSQLWKKIKDEVDTQLFSELNQ